MGKRIRWTREVCERAMKGEIPEGTTPKLATAYLRNKGYKASLALFGGRSRNFWTKEEDETLLRLANGPMMKRHGFFSAGERLKELKRKLKQGEKE